MYTKLLGCLGVAALISTSAIAQQTPYTAEDSLHSNHSFIAHTTIGGYGNVRYQRDFNNKTSDINLERFVLFIGHNFSKKVSFFSELEVEDAKVEGGEPGGEIALEQGYLKFSLNSTHYFVAGLFLPRIGILNENHLPPQFNGNERNWVETLVLPSTWRELGVGLYGQMNRLPMNYYVGLVNGLNSADFEHGSLIREGRFEGRNASANNLALTAAVQYFKGHFKTQLSGYYGGTVGLAPREADSLQLESGPFGTPVAIGEADLRYEFNGFYVKALGTYVSIPKAADINRAYANNTPEGAYGAYAEVAYNVLQKVPKAKGKQLIAFVRYEQFNLNSMIPENGITDGTLDQKHIVTGFSYLPMQNIVIKADVRLMKTGEQNPALVINPNALPYQTNNTFLNLGVGYSF